MQGVVKRVTIHDKQNIEVKFEYLSNLVTNKDTYRIDMFFFIPKQLEVNESTYPSSTFYNDTKTYTRLKEPVLALDRVADKNCKFSPLARLHEILEYPNSFDPKIITKEVKLYGVIVKARLRELEDTVLDELLPKGKESTILHIIEETFENYMKASREFRNLKDLFSSQYPLYSGEVQEAFEIVDDYTSAIAEGVFAKLAKYLSKSEKFYGIFSQIADFFQKEDTYRRSKNYKLIKPSNPKQAENYTHILSVYKKYISSVLFLDTQQNQKYAGFIHLIAAVAAALAMLAYLVITLPYSGSSAAVLTILTLSYVLKDRIKEVVRLKLSPYLLRYFPDHEVKVLDQQTSSVVAVCQEKIKFLNFEELEEAIKAARQPFLTASQIQLQEEIMQFSRRITVFTKKIFQIHSRTVTLTDIIRYNFRKFLYKMDEPVDILHFFDKNKKTPTQITAPRVYFVDLVLKISSHDQTVVEVYRVVLDKKGIKTVKKLS